MSSGEYNFSQETEKNLTGFHLKMRVSKVFGSFYFYRAPVRQLDAAKRNRAEHGLW